MPLSIDRRHGSSGLDHRVALTTIALKAQCFKITQVVTSSLGKRDAMVHFEARTNAASTTTDTGKMITL